MSGRVTQAQVEKLTQQIGREMFERVRLAAASPFQANWWQELALKQCMRHDWLKVQAFRFIDVLPTMAGAADVARHLREYFVHPAYSGGSRSRASAEGDGNGAGRSVDGGRGEADAPAADGSAGLLRWVARLMSFERADSPRARLLAWLAQRGAAAMAGRFIAGSTPAAAARAVRRLRGQRMTFTMDVLGEAALSDRESEYYQRVYLDLLTSLPREAQAWPHEPQIDEADGVRLPRVNVSVKLSALFSRFDAIAPQATAERVKAALRPLMRRALEGGAHLHVDMEHYAMKDLTLAIFRDVLMEDEFRDYPHFGIVLQAYLKDCERDAAELMEFARRRGTPLWVRLVKGAYWDTETVHYDQEGWPWPVWEQKWQSDACFERVSRLLLERHQYVRVGFGSHNVRSLAHAMALRRLLGVPGDRFELQMLYGMGDPIKHAAVAMGQRCRVYTPYGEMMPGMAYLIRRLLENTANESFLRNAADPDVPVEELLRDPEEIGRETPPFEKPPVLKFERGELIMDPFENVPNADFTREEERRRMLMALERARGGLGRQQPLIIGGQPVVTGQWFDSVNPSRPAEIIGRVARADAAAVERAVRAAREAFESWRRSLPRQRAEPLLEAARLMQQARFDLAALLALECAKPWREADAEVSSAIDYCNYYAREFVRLSGDVRRRDVAGETNEYGYAGRGVAAVISPASAPLAALAGMTAAAIVTGNTVVMKPASAAPVVAARWFEMLEQAGLPRGVVSYVPGAGSEVGELLAAHPGVCTIGFAGSPAVGARVYRLAAEHPCEAPGLKRVIAAMGGKNAIIVDSDADMDDAVKGVLSSAFAQAGQRCSACARCIVLEAVYERFVDRLVEAARGLSVGPADDPRYSIPPLVDAAAQRRVREYVEAGRREARCVLETDVRQLVEQTGGYFVGPTIFSDVPPETRLARDPVPGPVLALLRARDFDHAIELFNASGFGLAGGVYSRSPANLERARADCRCGNLYINRRITGERVDAQPFGGHRLSGLGAHAGGPDYLVQFCEARTITENTLRRGFAPTPSVEGLEAVSGPG